YFRLTTDMTDAVSGPLIMADIREAHFVYAREIVRLYHGESAVASAETRYREIAAGKLPVQMVTVRMDADEIGIGDLLKAVGFAESGSDARRLIAGGGIKLNGVVVDDGHLVVSNGRTTDGMGHGADESRDQGIHSGSVIGVALQEGPVAGTFVLSRGKNRFVRVVLGADNKDSTGIKD
ncbi:MAG: S4 domain-containing protein, partial [Saccharofermentanales bacterium]